VLLDRLNELLGAGFVSDPLQSRQYQTEIPSSGRSLAACFQFRIYPALTPSPVATSSFEHFVDRSWCVSLHRERLDALLRQEHKLASCITDAEVKMSCLPPPLVVSFARRARRTLNSVVKHRHSSAPASFPWLGRIEHQPLEWRVPILDITSWRAPL